MIHIMIADDQELFRHSLKYILQEQPDFEVVATAVDGSDTLVKASDTKPDVILMDIRMPKIDGVKCTEMIKESLPNTKVLILTTFDDEEYVFGALCNGASGYLLKGVSVQDLIRAIREVHNGGSIISPNVTHTVVQMFAKLARGNFCIRVNEQMENTLTLNERKVIQAVGQGLSNKEIAANLFLSEGTVRNYISAALSKLNLRDRTQLAIWALQTGVVEGLL